MGEGGRVAGLTASSSSITRPVTMEILWKGTLCIVCLEPSPFTEEHIIPAALGGCLTCRFLCALCNSKLGNSIEGHAKADPAIQLLARTLAGRIPQLASQLLEGQTYISSGPGGSSRGRVKDGEFVVRSEKLADDSLIQPTPMAAKSIRRMLERGNHDLVAIEKALALFELAPDNTRVALSETIEVIKWSVDSIRPAFDGPLLNLAVPLKTAYEFLALHLGTAIHDDAPALAAARQALKGGPIQPTHLLVERLSAPAVRPFHGLLLEGSTPYTTVQVRLLGELAFRVHFKTLEIGGPRFVYTHDLSSNEEQVILAQTGPNFDA